MKKDLPLLLNLACVGYNRALVPGKDLAPVFNPDGSVQKTFCNLFIQYVLNGFGYSDMNVLMANEMVEFMREARNGWLAVDEATAQAHANEGVIVIAGRGNPSGHGHVCLILPGILEKSGDWNKPVPKCVNVGKDVFFGKKVSYAFRKEEQPDFFVRSEMI